MMGRQQIMTEFCMEDERTLHNVETVLLPRWHYDLAEAELANANGCIENIVSELREKIRIAEERLEQGKARLKT